MKVATGLTNYFPKLNEQLVNNKPVWQIGSNIPRAEVRDLLEISDQARQIAADNFVIHEAVKVDIKDRPIGAPDDYIPMTALMQRFDTQSYEEMNAFFKEGKDEAGLGILIAFAKKLPMHPSWLAEYRKEMQRSISN